MNGRSVSGEIFKMELLEVQKMCSVTFIPCLVQLNRDNNFSETAVANPTSVKEIITLKKQVLTQPLHTMQESMKWSQSR